MPAKGVLMKLIQLFILFAWCLGVQNYAYAKPQMLLWFDDVAEKISSHITSEGAIQCRKRHVDVRGNFYYWECRMEVEPSQVKISKTEIHFSGAAAKRFYETLTYTEYSEVDIPNPAYNMPQRKGSSEDNTSDILAYVTCARSNNCRCEKTKYRCWLKSDKAIQFAALLVPIDQ